MDNDLSINNENNLNKNLQKVTYENQKSFLESNLGQVINRWNQFRIKGSSSEFNRR